MTAQAAPRAEGCVLLAPSAGLGGGIERYVETVQWALHDRSVPCRRLNLDRPGPAGHGRLVARAATALRSSGPVRIIAAHRALLPAAMAFRRHRAVTGISVICHGSDVWGSSRRPRWWLEQRLMQRDDVRVVTASSFTAGAVGARCRATVLTPGVSRSWFDQLRAAAAEAANMPPSPEVRLVTAFRLADWRDKGLPELLAALALLDHPRISLTVCGSGPVPPSLAAAVGDLAWCGYKVGLADAALAAELARADLVVLATRTRSGRCPSGEGFGLVLLEAQLAGTPVLAPASGGCREAYLDGVTGIAPRGESAMTLAVALGELLADPAGLRQMGQAAGRWATARFSPDLYAAQAVSRLCGP